MGPEMEQAGAVAQPDPLARRRQPAPDTAEPARLTLRISAEKAHRLREVARQRGVSVNCLLDEMVSLAVFEFELTSSAARGA
jgi:predicted HicB family RNase H-like nuclease